MNSDAPIFEDQQGSIIAPRSKSLFPSGVSLGRNSSLDADDLMRRALGTVNKAVIPDESDSAPSPIEPEINFSFKAKITGALEFTVQPGSAEIAPDTVIAVTCNIIQTVTPGSEAWYGWVDVDSTADTAVAYFGADWPAALSSVEKLTIRRKRILQISLVDGSLSAIKNLQCGNVDVFDPAEVEPAEPWTNMYVITQGATPSVSFTAGDVSWGSKRATVTGTAGGNITNNNWWGIKVTPDGGGIAAEWVEKATIAEFTSGEDATSIEYYQFQIVGGIASIKAIAAKGNWKIPSVFAPE